MTHVAYLSWGRHVLKQINKWFFKVSLVKTVVLFRIKIQPFHAQRNQLGIKKEPLKNIKGSSYRVLCGNNKKLFFKEPSTERNQKGFFVWYPKNHFWFHLAPSCLNVQYIHICHAPVRLMDVENKILHFNCNIYAQIF